MNKKEPALIKSTWIKPSIKFDSTLIFQDEKNGCVKLYPRTLKLHLTRNTVTLTLKELKRVGVIASKELTEEQTLKIQALKLNVRALNK